MPRVASFLWPALAQLLLLSAQRVSGGAFSATTSNGVKWSVTNNADHTLAATVPGTLHLDLMKAGILEEDPLYRYNEKKYVWVTKERWVYSTTLDMSSYPVSASDASAPWLLRFDGVDTVANVTWNGKPLGSPRSMFVAFTYEIPGAWLSADGLNKVEVAIEPAMEYTAGLRDQTPYSIPEVLFYNTWPGYSAKNFVRKPSSDFGWDWGPAFIPVGIVGDVRLMKSSVGQLEDVLVFQEHHADGSVTLTVKSIVANVPKDGASAKLTVALSELGDGKGTTRTVQLAGGENEFIDTLTMPKPELWWPVGLGQPRLYRLTVTLAYADGTVAVVKEKNVGFRTIEVVETPVEGSEGLSFFFKVNGVEVFVKGANLIPFHVFYNQATHEEMDWILQSSVDANMNMVRVWGGGYYEPDEFYDLCDEKGLMVWQEIMFACALYPRDSGFLGLVESEVRQQVRRLQSHPSIALWGGNNENEVALTWFSQSTTNRDLYVVDYNELYINTIYKTLASIDPKRAWVDSSPSNGLISRDPYVKRWGQPGDLKYGDLHHYDFYSDCEMPASFPNARFISEFGFQSLPSYETYSGVLSVEDYNRNSDLLNFRQRHDGGNAQIEFMVDKHFKLPPVTVADGNATRQRQVFDDYLYLTQLQQGRCYETAVSSWRRNKATSAKTMGILYWQLNDVWQGPTWSSIEYGGKWKALHYMLKRVYSPILVSGYRDAATDMVYVHLTSDLRPGDRIKGRVTVRLHSYSDGKALGSWDKAVDMPGNHSMLVMNATSAFFLTGLTSTASSSSDKDKSPPKAVPLTVTDTFVTATFEAKDDPNMAASTAVVYLSAYKDAKLPPAKVTVKAVKPTDKPDTVTVELSSNATALFVLLEALGLPGHFSDNAFLLLPDHDHHVTFTSRNKAALDPNDVATRLQVRSLWDTVAHLPPAPSATSTSTTTLAATTIKKERSNRFLSHPYSSPSRSALRGLDRPVR